MTSGYIRSPRCYIAIAGDTLTPKQCELSVSQHQSSDTFSATIALDDPSGLDESYWADTAPITAQILATNDIATSPPILMFTGQVEKPEIDFAARTVHISGRDKTANLLDNKTNEKWLNKQPQDIINDLAGRVGLSVQFNGSNPDRAGLKFNQDYNRISEYDSYWNVIVKLAKQIGCIAFVKQNTLYIQPWDTASGGVFNVYYQRPTAESYANGSFVGLKCSRDLNLAKTVTVNHKSWQHKPGQAIESEFTLPGAGGELAYTYKLANLTKAQQDAIASARLGEITSHERTVVVECPGDVAIDPTMMLVLTGTGTGFDQAYVISSIRHNWSFSQGYRMTVSTRNKDGKRGGIEQNK